MTGLIVGILLLTVKAAALVMMDRLFRQPASKAA
jgi:hypothetical protein